MKAGDVIAGRYRLESKLGEGGLGVVWRATELGIERSVAIKFLKTTRGDDLRRFDIEARALARLQHPGCVTLHDFGRTDDGQRYLAMELLHGEPLEVLRRTSPSIDRIRDVLHACLEVLSYAHREGIAHRDLKPENIFLTPSDRQSRIKVLDFGLAKMTGLDTVDVTKTGEVFGTPVYMSPEQLRGSRDAGPPSDIYALGVIAFELLEGHPPFEGRSLLELAGGHLTQEIPPIRREDCPESMRRLVVTMLQKEASRRPTASYALAQLDASGAPTVRGTTPVGERSGVARTEATPSRRRFTVASASAMTLIVAIGLSALVLSRGDRGAPDPVPPSPGRVSHPVSGLLQPQQNEGKGDQELAEPTSVDRCEKPVVAGTNVGRTLVGTARVEWTMHVPRGFNRGQPAPILFLFGHDNVSSQQFFKESGFVDLAEREGIVLIGIERAGRTDDLAAQVDAVRGEVRSDLCIEGGPTFAVGHFVGGNAARQISCEPWLTAVATVAHLPDKSSPGPCRPAHPVPALHIAPLDTKHVPVDGGPRCDLPFAKEAMSLNALEEQWRMRNELIEVEAEISKRPGGACSRWGGPFPFVSCRVAGGSGWPGTTRQHGTFCDTAPGDFDATETIWEFFEANATPPPKGCAADEAPDEKYVDVQFAGEERRIWTALPTNYVPRKPSPVLLVAAHQRRRPDQHAESRAGFEAAARAAGYLLLAPMPRDHHDPWASAADVELLRQTVELVGAHVCLDRSRVFAIGHADGGTQVQRLACEMPLAGIALTGTLDRTGEKCAPIQTTPTLRLLARDDMHVPIEGGDGCNDWGPFESADDTDERWRTALGCHGEKQPWSHRPHDCEAWTCDGGPYLSCRVSGSHYFEQSDLAVNRTGMLGQDSPGCGDPKGHFDLQFEKTVLPFFREHGRTVTAR